MNHLQQCSHASYGASYLQNSLLLNLSKWEQTAYNHERDEKGSLRNSWKIEVKETFQVVESNAIKLTATFLQDMESFLHQVPKPV